MPYHGIFAEARRLLVLLLVVAAIGAYNGYTLAAIAVGLFLYLCFHLYHLFKLIEWLRRPELATIPDASGLWAQVFEHLSRQKRKELRERKRLKGVIARVQATTAALKDAVILLNADNTLYWWNQATEKFLKLRPSDSGNSIINYIRHPDFVHYLDTSDYKIPLNLPSPRNHEIQLEYQITRFGEGESLIVVRDITRLYKLEKMRKDFVANVSHELRTPLTVIRGYLETMADSQVPHSKDHQNWQKALLQMQQQAERMTALINELTMLSKLETDPSDSGQHSVPLRPLLEMICNEARAVSGNESHSINLDCDPSIMLYGNDRELHSAFSNLITNAIKYSAAKKPIDIDVYTNRDNDLEVSVSDQGIGIENQHINRITERFYRVDDSRSKQTGGTGLGLAIVKHVMLRHEGLLLIDSEPGVGSTFSCVFPAYRVDEQSTPIAK